MAFPFARAPLALALAVGGALCLPVLADEPPPVEPLAPPLAAPADPAPSPAPAAAKEAARLDVAFVLDTTGSMSGLIESAKRKIWAIANDLAQGDPSPEIRIGIVAYRVSVR